MTTLLEKMIFERLEGNSISENFKESTIGKDTNSIIKKYHLNVSEVLDQGDPGNFVSIQIICSLDPKNYDVSEDDYIEIMISSDGQDEVQFSLGFEIDGQYNSGDEMEEFDVKDPFDWKQIKPVMQKYLSKRLERYVDRATN